MQQDELQEIINRNRRCPDLKPYVTAKGGVVVLNGPFPTERAKSAADFIEHAKSDIHRLAEEVLRLQRLVAQP